VRLRVSQAEKYDYTDVVALTMVGEGVEARLELPVRVMEEAGWYPPPVGAEVEVELAQEPGGLDEWEIALSGVLLKRGEGLVAYTFGGLLLTLRGAVGEPPRKVYLKLRRAREG